MSSGYKGFPSFDEWAAQANGFEAFNFAASNFQLVGEEQKKLSRMTATRLAAVDTNATEGALTCIVMVNYQTFPELGQQKDPTAVVGSIAVSY